MSKIALLFPGQGSQKVGMGKEIAETNAEAAQVFQEADQALGYSLSELCFEGPEEELVRTYHAQPALLTTSIALHRAFAKAGFAPDFVAGHSLGEYSALVAAGSLTFQDAVTTVHKRGKYMEEAVPGGEGAMLAVLSLERETIDELCREVTQSVGVVEVANYNCPGQIVVSGEAEAVRVLGEKAREAGARKVVPLSVGGPFHSSLMKPAADRLEQILAQVDIKEAHPPVIPNVTGTACTSAEEIRRFLTYQVASPVLWEDTVSYLLKQGVDTFVEIGSGKVLGGLVKKVDRKVSILSIQDSNTLAEAVETLQRKAVKNA